MMPMQPSRVLNERSLPRDRQRQEERIESRVVEPFTNEATRRQYQALLIIGNASKGQKLFLLGFGGI